MSEPTSLKLGLSLPVDPRIITKDLLAYILQIWISLIPAAFLLFWIFAPANIYGMPENLFPWGIPYSFLQWVGPMFPIWLYYILLPLFLIGIYYVAVIFTTFITVLRIKWLNWRHPPKEGLFSRTLEDLDFVYWNKRNLSRRFLAWLLFSTPFSWGRNFFALRVFGIKIGKGVVVDEGWISPEFIELGNNIRLGQGAGIYSYMYEQDKLLVATVRIEDNVIIGPRCTIFPGTKIHTNTIVSASSYTIPFSELEAESIYFGTPAQFVRKKKDHEC